MPMMVMSIVSSMSLTSLFHFNFVLLLYQQTHHFLIYIFFLQRWNPRVDGVLASCGDDGLVKIWRLNPDKVMSATQR